MTDQVKTHFAGSSSGDEETNLLKVVASLDSAQKVLERHAHIDVNSTSIRDAFDFLNARARSLPHVKQHPTSGHFEFKSEGEDQYEKTIQNGKIHDAYNRWQPLADDSFGDVLIQRLIDSYSQYPEVVASLKTIRNSLIHEKELKEFYISKFEPYQIYLAKEEFKQNCFKNQKPDSAAGPISKL
ncbi:MAG TPA: hypothetical protein PKX38_01175 [Alphaproteobacteria bacterium]|nr:hypothetical protein [Micavibrio sp.]MBK9563178.1 hypothetical protein [Micavibrio sp.]HQX26529.1 hypothetical protein [Alphaproteobacteria bacterium]